MKNNEKKKTNQEPGLSTVKGRLLAFIKHEHLTQSEFARRLGVAPAYIGAMRKSLPEEKVLRLCSLFPNLNRDWLLYGEGEMLLSKEKEEKANLQEIERYEVPLLPVSAFAGKLQDWAEAVGPGQCETVMTPLKDVDFAIRISGDSMEPNFHDGSTLLIKRINERAFIPWGHAMVIDTENGVLVKVVYPGKNAEPRLDGAPREMYIEARSYNTQYPPIEIPTSCIYGLYRVMGCMQIYSTM